MNECMHAWTDCCLCVCLCMCMWLGGSVDLFAGWSSLHLSSGSKEPLRIAISLQIGKQCKS